jgi:hypothetical protein
LVERFMSGRRTERRWQSDLIERHPGLFTITENDQSYPPGYPSVGDGWRDLVQRAIERIAAAVSGAPDNCLKIVQIKEKYATIRIYWSAGPGLTDAMRDGVEEVIELAEARSACTCETCGEPGRLFKLSCWFMTACDVHGKGEPVAERRDLENVHVVYRIVDGEPVPRARRYIRATDSFVDLPPGSLGIEE